MPKWNVTPLPGAVVETRDCTLSMGLVQVEASSYDDAIQQGQAVYFLQGYKFPKSKLAAAKDGSTLPSWHVYLKTGPLVTYPSIDEVEALKRLAKMCDEWGLNIDSFVLERSETSRLKDGEYEIWCNAKHNRVGPYFTWEAACAAAQNTSAVTGDHYIVRRVGS